MKKGVQCHEFEGYTHIAADCANTRAKKEDSNRGICATWSDEEDDVISNFVIFAKTKSEDESQDISEDEEDDNNDELQDAYNRLYLLWD